MPPKLLRSYSDFSMHKSMGREPLTVRRRPLETVTAAATYFDPNPAKIKACFEFSRVDAYAVDDYANGPALYRRSSRADSGVDIHFVSPVPTNTISAFPNDNHIVAAAPLVEKCLAVAVFYSAAPSSLARLNDFARDRTRKKLAEDMEREKGEIDKKIEEMRGKKASDSSALILRLLKNLSKNLEKQHLINNSLIDKAETDKYAKELFFLISKHVSHLIKAVEVEVESAAEAKPLYERCNKALENMSVMEQKFPEVFKLGEMKGVLAATCVLAGLSSAGQSLPVVGAIINGLLSANEVKKGYRTAILQCYGILLRQMKEDLIEIREEANSRRIDELENQNAEISRRMDTIANQNAAPALIAPQEAQAPLAVIGDLKKQIQALEQQLQALNRRFDKLEAKADIDKVDEVDEAGFMPIEIDAN